MKLSNELLRLEGFVVAYVFVLMICQAAGFNPSLRAMPVQSGKLAGQQEAGHGLTFCGGVQSIAVNARCSPVQCKEMEPFRMKEFSVVHDQCAMRVNTDGCLLGALAAHETDANRVGHILDVGTGCGVIALQMAQRFKQAFVDAVDIHGPSVRQATENFRNSPWPQRLVCHCESFQDMITFHRYDIIVSNPPFFPSDDHMAPLDAGKASAKHSACLDFKALLEKSAKLLRATGSLWVVLPYDITNKFMREASNAGFFLRKKIKIHPKEGHGANRCICALSKEGQADIEERDITMYNQDSKYTDEVRDIFKPFFISPSYYMG